MPAKGVYKNPLQYVQCNYELPTQKDEIIIYLYNRICTLEQKIRNIETLLRQQCESCQYKKVAKNVRSILG